MKNIDGTTYYSLADLVEATGVYRSKIAQMLEAGLIEQPTHTIDGRAYWKLREFTAAIRAVLQPLWTIKDVAAQLGISENHLAKLVREHKLPQGNVVLCRRRLYTPAHFKQVRREWLLLQQRDRPKPHVKRNEAGYWSLTDVAAKAGVAIISVTHWIKNGGIKPPSHQIPGVVGRYYSTAEKDSIVAFFEARKDLPWLSTARKKRSR